MITVRQCPVAGTWIRGFLTALIPPRFWQGDYIERLCGVRCGKKREDGRERKRESGVGVGRQERRAPSAGTVRAGDVLHLGRRQRCTKPTPPPARVRGMLHPRRAPAPSVVCSDVNEGGGGRAQDESGSTQGVPLVMRHKDEWAMSGGYGGGCDEAAADTLHAGQMSKRHKGRASTRTSGMGTSRRGVRPAADMRLEDGVGVRCCARLDESRFTALGVGGRSTAKPAMGALSAEGHALWTWEVADSVHSVVCSLSLRTPLKTDG
ncbi:hypothetical protein C8F04DRAFT_1180339 [Mycena alexandri]|uniref:Uncharacterized protein n=1 Tax=Mycena alexandri TaxID=1745969 RepID=A0AAD6WVB9_9AGAR|nr:hypothetical protein C8F04DRAFT_1190849 [Mycena alexandri]KAJ7029424.1 hypothetical protein C8F04DRAFT_1187636 [Mycena alexandri]KAJ7037598.1 hypothetical protein C8F04DRAFT_1180339 [Mycena alexandri]